MTQRVLPRNFVVVRTTQRRRRSGKNCEGRRRNGLIEEERVFFVFALFRERTHTGSLQIDGLIDHFSWKSDIQQ